MANTKTATGRTPRQEVIHTFSLFLRNATPDTFKAEYNELFNSWAQRNGPMGRYLRDLYDNGTSRQDRALYNAVEREAKRRRGL